MTDARIDGPLLVSNLRISDLQPFFLFYLKTKCARRNFDLKNVMVLNYVFFLFRTGEIVLAYRVTVLSITWSSVTV